MLKGGQVRNHHRNYQCIAMCTLTYSGPSHQRTLLPKDTSLIRTELLAVGTLNVFSPPSHHRTPLYVGQNHLPEDMSLLEGDYIMTSYVYILHIMYCEPSLKGHTVEIFAAKNLCVEGTL